MERNNKWTILPSFTGRTMVSTETVLPCGSTLRVLQEKGYKEAWGRSTTVLRCYAVFIAPGPEVVGMPQVNLSARTVTAARIEALAWAQSLRSGDV